MDQKEKFSTKKSILVQFKNNQTRPKYFGPVQNLFWTYRRTRQKSPTFPIEIFQEF